MSVFLFLIITSCIPIGQSKVFSRCELANELKYKYDIPEYQLATWVCIAHYESHYNTTAIGHTNEDRSGDHGLFQVSDIYWCSPPGIGLACGISCSQLEDDDITDDVTCIRRIFRAHEKQTGNGFSAWAVYEPYCKSNISNFIDDCFPITNSKTTSTTQTPYIQITRSQSNRTSTLPETSVHLYRPWWLQTVKSTINFGQTNYITNYTTLRPVWFNSQKTGKPSSFTTHQLVLPSLTTSKPVFTSSAAYKPIWSSSAIPTLVWPSSVEPKLVGSSYNHSQLVYFNNQKANLNFTRGKIIMTPVWFNNQQTKIYPSRKITSEATQTPSMFYNQNTNLYFTRKSNLTTISNPLWSRIQKTNVYSTQKQVSKTSHKPSWYETWYQNNFVNRLFNRKQSDNYQH